MNWFECARSREAAAPWGRFFWPENSDFNCVEGTTISDWWGGFMWLLTYPGDAVLAAVAHDPKWGAFFEITPLDVIGTWLSTAIGAVFAVVLLAIPGALLDMYDNRHMRRRD